MLDGIGEACGKEGYRVEIQNNECRKVILTQQSEFEQEKKFPKMLGHSAIDPSIADEEERTSNRIRLEDGVLKIETYTENGELVKITPPGYLPLDKTA